MKEHSKDYSRLEGSKIYYINFTRTLFERLIKTFDDEEIGAFMTGLYNYIYVGVEPKWETRKYQTMWYDVLTEMNKNSEGWFRWKQKQKEIKEYKNILEDN